MVLILVAMLAVAADDPTFPAPVAKKSAPSVRATADGADARLSIREDDATTVVDVTSQRGIGRATLARSAGVWPKAIALRLHLTGLESLEIRVGDRTIAWSVASTGTHETTVTLKSDGRETTLGKDSPYHGKIRLVAREPTIPLRDGYFELRLPAKLLEENPPDLQLQWIDFYRN